MFRIANGTFFLLYHTRNVSDCGAFNFRILSKYGSTYYENIYNKNILSFDMDKVKILFASDIHGNKIQYDKLFFP
jgi:hypothetical protein